MVNLLILSFNFSELEKYHNQHYDDEMEEVLFQKDRANYGKKRRRG